MGNYPASLGIYKIERAIDAVVVGEACQFVAWEQRLYLFPEGLIKPKAWPTHAVIRQECPAKLQEISEVFLLYVIKRFEPGIAGHIEKWVSKYLRGRGLDGYGIQAGLYAGPLNQFPHEPGTCPGPGVPIAPAVFHLGKDKLGGFS